MSMFCCECKCGCKCTIASIIASVIVGIIAAFLQITGVITVTDAFLWVVLGIAVVYLAVLLLTFAVARKNDSCGCKCVSLSALLYGILGSALVSVILLAIGTVAGSVVSAILVALLLISLSLIITSSACLVKCLADCGE